MRWRRLRTHDAHRHQLCRDPWTQRVWRWTAASISRPIHLALTTYLAVRGSLWPLLRVGTTWFTFGADTLGIFRALSCPFLSLCGVSRHARAFLSATASR